MEHQTIGKVIHKSTRQPLSDKEWNPIFISIKYDEQKYGSFLHQHINMGPQVPQHIKAQLICLIQEFWCCFDHKTSIFLSPDMNVISTPVLQNPLLPKISTLACTRHLSRKRLSIAFSMLNKSLSTAIANGFPNASLLLSPIKSTSVTSKFLCGTFALFI